MINDPENRNFESKIWSFWPIWGVIFDYFGGQKSRFLDFFKVVLELFKKCLGIVFDLKRTTLTNWGGIQKLSLYSFHVCSGGNLMSKIYSFHVCSGGNLMSKIWNNNTLFFRMSVVLVLCSVFLHIFIFYFWIKNLFFLNPRSMGYLEITKSREQGFWLIRSKSFWFL